MKQHISRQLSYHHDLDDEEAMVHEKWNTNALQIVWG